MEYIKNQQIFNAVIDSINNHNKYVQAYIICGTNDELLERASKILAKTLICQNKYNQNCNKCNICMRIDKGEYNELLDIYPTNNSIKVEDTAKFIEKFSKQPIEGKNQVYIINQAECLIPVASNKLLKFLEEPDSNTVAIFTTKNINQIIKTIVSRCQIINLVELKDNDSKLIEHYESDSKEILDMAIDFYIRLINDKEKTVYMVNKSFLDKLRSKEALDVFFQIILLLFMDELNSNIYGKRKLFLKYDIPTLSMNNEEIINKINFTVDNNQKIKYNVNSTLFINNYIIGIGEL